MKKRWIGIALALLVAVAAFGDGVDWSSAKLLFPGIRFVALKKTKPRLIRLFIMRIDLKTPGLSFTVTGRDPDWGKPMPDFPKLPIRTRRTTTAEFMRNIVLQTAQKRSLAGSIRIFNPLCQTELCRTRSSRNCLKTGSE